MLAATRRPPCGLSIHSPTIRSCLVRPPSRRSRCSAHALPAAASVRPAAPAESPATAWEAEAAARRAAYEAQRAAELEAAAAGLSWWEVGCPPNMRNISTLEELTAAVESHCAAGGLAVINFFAPECYTCRSLHAKLCQLIAAAPDVLLLKVDGTASPQLTAYCEQAGVDRIPYFHFHKGGDGSGSGSRIVAAFSASLRPEKLARLRAELATHSRPSSSSSSAAAAATISAR